MNQIFHYRLDGRHLECGADDPWGKCLINSDTNFDDFKIKPLVAIGGQPIIQQHQATYITGRDTCHAHHFVKMLAGAILSGDYRHAPSLNIPASNDSTSDRVDCAATPVTASTSGKVLWIDTVHGPHACATLYQEMEKNFHIDEGQLHLMCLDMLGVFREDFYDVLSRIENHIRNLKPTLVVIDDIDHFLPYCGINVAARFSHIFRDTLNHTETAFLMIGYNHLGKRASTTGNLGKLIFPSSDAIFSVTTQNGISHVKLVRALLCPQKIPDAEFIFSIGDDNLPHELVKTMPSGTVFPTHVEQTTLQDIITEVIEPGETISPDELVTRISKRRAQLNRIDRARTLIAQATAFGLIKKTDDPSNHYTLIPSMLNDSNKEILTLPPHPSNDPSPRVASPSSPSRCPSSLCRNSVAATTPTSNS